MFAPLVLALVLPAAEPNEAEKLYRQMEEKVTKAKAIECAFDSKVEGPENMSIKGTFQTAEDNKLRMEVDVDDGGKKEKASLISDGKKMATRSGTEKQETKDVHASFGETFRAAFARVGVYLSVMVIIGPGAADKEFKADEEFKLSDFKLGKKEKVGDREAQAVEFTLTLKDKSAPKISGTVWIDAGTHLPLKRVLTADKDNKKITVTETYAKVNPDAKIDAKQFELPKE